MILAAVLLTGVAACGDDDTDPSAAGSPTSPTATMPATSAPPGAPVPPGASTPPGAEPTSAVTPSADPAPSCVTGRWRATGVASAGSIGDARGRIAGGTGTAVTVDPDGRTEVDFRAAKPLTFTAEAAGADVRGTVAYKGSFRGSVTFDGSDGTGRWIPQGRISWSDLNATVRLSEPFTVTLLDGVNLADITRDTLPGAAGAVDVQPILRGGTYECAGQTLRLRTRANGPDVTWTFTRA
ncbi:hypothetical protein Aau02nite_48610 [Amorphoplanes auranticolor]|uniref:Uncharacterized protein n=2 Tax=Actinoplanes auranticolor TaxID=47988 RepID=A0A919VQ06_9ACTN|nr:hypothetical protein Aau02nite_48610 [Actinoplanes auranticolor]